MARTKKVGPAGRFGARYGSTVRGRWGKIEVLEKTPTKCPSCQTKAVRRLSTGIWKCRKCGYTFTGGAWVPATDAQKIQRSFHEGAESGRTE